MTAEGKNMDRHQNIDKIRECWRFLKLKHLQAGKDSQKELK